MEFFKKKLLYWKQQTNSYPPNSMVFEFTVDAESGLTYTACMYGKCTIDWGDGNVETITGASSYHHYAWPKEFSHTYNEYGKYIVIIDATELLGLRNSYGQNVNFKGQNMITKALALQMPAWNTSGMGPLGTLFGNCRRLKSIPSFTYLASLVEKSTYNGGFCGGGGSKYGTFYYCDNLDFTNFVFPSNQTYIEMNSFSGCKNFKISRIPDGVTSIGLYAFRECKGLTEMYLPSSITSINVSTFDYSSNLKDIYVPWAEGEVAGAPWGALAATIHYNHTPDNQ